MSRYPSLGPHTITVVTAGTTTDRGNNAVLNWSPAAVTETTVSGCMVQPRTSAESTDGRNQRIVGALLLAPAGTLLTAINRVRWSDLTFEVDGEPLPWPHLDRPGVDHIEAALKIVSG